MLFVLCLLTLLHGSRCWSCTGTRTQRALTPLSATPADASSTRRAWLASIAATTAATAVPLTSSASASTPISATWSAVEGLHSLAENQDFVGFDLDAYRAMRDDPTRTPLFRAAIEHRLGDDPKSATVLDLGTGPFALFAIMAAELGARKVYAIEANPQAAASARTFVEKAGFIDRIVILEGFSTQIDLPEPVDFVVAEIVGSVASEEGAYATLVDAHRRLVKAPDDPRSWIPQRMQTYAAPASYTLHTLLGPPEFDWTKLGGEPVRFNCRDEGLQLLADPILIEDIGFASILNDVHIEKQRHTFVVDADRLHDNTLAAFQEFRRTKSSVTDSERLASATGHSLSGIALWPRLILNDSIVVDSREFGSGRHQRSHWQTVLPIMSARPIAVEGGDQVNVEFDFVLPTQVDQPPRYSMQGQVVVA